MSTYFDILVTYLGEAHKNQNKAIKLVEDFFIKHPDFKSWEGKDKQQNQSPGVQALAFSAHLR